MVLAKKDHQIISIFKKKKRKQGSKQKNDLIKSTASPCSYKIMSGYFAPQTHLSLVFRINFIILLFNLYSQSKEREKKEEEEKE